MTNLFYIVGVLNSMYLIMFITLAVCIGAFICSYMDITDSERGTRKLRRLSGIVGLISLLWVIFVPSGDTYLAMKVSERVGEERIEDVLEILDKKIEKAAEEAELIDYD